ncbi:MAG: hypothetical protein H0U76_13965 [Ktedonobacteraceae bacterium]|nr:hypothetical protein [Ktedonobacteraceae bacterium]
MSLDSSVFGEMLSLSAYLFLAFVIRGMGTLPHGNPRTALAGRTLLWGYRRVGGRKYR